MSEVADKTRPVSSYDRRLAVQHVLEADETLLGRIYRYELDGKTPQEIADLEGNQRPNFVHNYRIQIRGPIESEIPSSPTISTQLARRVRAWLKQNSLSEPLRSDLQSCESLLQSRATDKDAQAEEIDSAVAASKKAEQTGTPGIYVYTLPHYLQHPVDETTGKTLLKVGHSAKDAYYRAGSAGRLTSLPEDPILLRIYPVEESASAEKIHEWLRDADHFGARTKRAGSEWFVTSTKFLDRIALSMSLEVGIVNDFEAGEE